MTGLPSNPPSRESLWPSVGHGALALVLAVLIADGAVETLLRGSPLRWIVLSTSVVLLLLMAVLCRRSGADAAATVGLLGSLAVLALTAWLPGGVQSGVTVLGQPTPRVLSGACALALLLAVGLFARAKIMPGVMRWVLGGLAAYAAVAFIQGALLIVPYDQLLRGQSLLTWLPRWLQGAFLGSLIAFPAAMVLAFVRDLSPPRRPVRARLHAGAWGLLVALAFAGLRASTGPISGQGQTRANGAAALQTSEPALVQPPRTPQNFETQGQPASGTSPDQARTHYLAAVGKLKSSIDYAQIDIGARQAKIGNDPQAISSYVQEQIRYEAYSGALRGARGTLLARAGNSVDRALLQAALSKAAGHRTRFAVGHLTAGQAEGLIRAAFKPPAPFDLKSPGGEIGGRAFDHFVLLGNALEDSGFKAPAGDAGTWDRTVREAQQHVWVQFEKAGQWLDADSSPGVSFGRALVGPDRVMDALDPNLFDTIEFSVEVETVQDGKRATRQILEQRALSADLAGVVVGFFHEKGSLSATPVLLIGDQTFKGTPFNIPNEGLGGLGGKIASSIGSLFETSPRPASSVTGEWLNIRTGGLAGERSAKYTIVDTTGQAAREAGQPPADPAVAEKQVSGALGGVLGILVNTGRLPAALLAALIVDMPDPATAQAQALTRMLTVQSASFAVVRGSMPSTFFDSLPVAYIDSPNVVISRVQPAAALPAAQDSMSIDLVLKGYRTVRMPEDPLRAGGSFYDRVAAGVIDHMTERWVLGTDLPAESVGALFETARDQNIAPRVVKNGDRAPLDYLSPDARIRLSAALTRGQLAVVPQARPSVWRAPLGWWNIDPATGWTEDTTELGCHQDAVEESVTLRSTAMRAFDAFCRLSGYVNVALYLAVMIEGPPELSVSPEFFKEAIDEFCAMVRSAAEAGQVPVGMPPPPPSATPKPGFTPWRNPPTLPPKTPDVNNWFNKRGTYTKWR